MWQHWQGRLVLLGKGKLIIGMTYEKAGSAMALPFLYLYIVVTDYSEKCALTVYKHKVTSAQAIAYFIIAASLFFLLVSFL
jgi:hypothetical protein